MHGTWALTLRMLKQDSRLLRFHLLRLGVAILLGFGIFVMLMSSGYSDSPGKDFLGMVAQGNFLVITYRELRLLELEVLRSLYKGGQGLLDIREVMLLNVDQLYGIEIEEFPARIAEVAMWLIDHQMNMLVSNEFGQYFVRLPLQKAANIVHGNALRMDWEVVVPKKRLSYILGNPPFIGYAWQSSVQKEEMASIFEGYNGVGVLDYVAAWYIKAARYIRNTNIAVAFVSTKSIVQGEQAGILWSILFTEYGIKIFFAHRTFKWNNEAKANAAVHVVIIGFSIMEIKPRKLFDYDDITSEPHELEVKNINQYLIDAKSIIIAKRSTPISNVPELSRGSDAIDDGNLLLDEEQYKSLIENAPESKQFIKPFLMGREFINNIRRYCIWLYNEDFGKWGKIPEIKERVSKVRAFRLASKRPQTLKAAQTPYLFGEIRHPESDYLAIPKVSSESRDYIPIGFCSKDTVCGDKLFYLSNANLYHFGIISSKNHMIWMRHVGGRLKSDYSYSNTIVYNNFPWPESPSEKQKAQIEQAAQAVLDARAQFPESSLADLYDPLTMPPVLLKAHQELDKAVDLAYRPQPFPSEAKRMEFLFELYEKYTAGLFGGEKKGKKKKSAKA